MFYLQPIKSSLHLGISQNSLTILRPLRTGHHGIRLWSGFLQFRETTLSVRHPSITRLSVNGRTWRSPAVVVVAESLRIRVHMCVSLPVEAPPSVRRKSDVSTVAAPVPSQARVWRSRAKKKGSSVFKEVQSTKCSYTCVKICADFQSGLPFDDLDFGLHFPENAWEKEGQADWMS